MTEKLLLLGRQHWTRAANSPPGVEKIGSAQNNLWMKGSERRI